MKIIKSIKTKESLQKANSLLMKRLYIFDAVLIFGLCVRTTTYKITAKPCI